MDAIIRNRLTRAAPSRYTSLGFATHVGTACVVDVGRRTMGPAMLVSSQGASSAWKDSSPMAALTPPSSPPWSRLGIVRAPARFLVGLKIPDGIGRARNGYGVVTSRMKIDIGVGVRCGQCEQISRDSIKYG